MYDQILVFKAFLGQHLKISSAYKFAGINVAVIVLSMVGKLFIETNFEMIYIVTAEIYPTTARVTALGMGSAIARVAGALAPYVVLTVSTVFVSDDGLW